MTDGQVTFKTIPADDDGQRLDRWLKKNVPDIPYTLVQKMIRQGQFRIDGKRAKTDTRLIAGQSVRIPPHTSADYKPVKPKLSDQDKQFIHSLIIYDDGDVIAINKPADLAVQGGSGIKRHIDGMLPALVNREGVVPRLVHRLDRDTSGVLLLARSARVARILGEMFKGRAMRKIYWAITHGVPDPREGTIRAGLVKAGGANKERMVVDDEEGKSAITEYAVIDNAHRSAAFVAFWPRTGRTHQIRVHAELMGTPILGDEKYAGNNLENPPPPIDGIEVSRTLHLHAHRLIFKHPVTGKPMDIAAPLPPLLQRSWKALGFETKSKADPFANLEV